MKWHRRGKETPATRPWRSLLRVLRLDDTGVWLVIPGWDPRAEVFVSWDKLPASFRPYMKPVFRFYAMVNIGAENVDDLVFSDWELPRATD